MKIHNCDQNDPEWEALRAGRPTASCFSKIITGKGKESSQLPGYAKLLACEVLAGNPIQEFAGNKWTDRGHELEDSAAAKYELYHNVDAVQVGFVTDDAEQYGASPDRLIGDDGCLEIKCLKAENHLDVLMGYAENGQVPVSYYPQVQGQLLVTERKWNDLTFYHPNLPMLVVRFEREEAYISSLRRGVNEVLRERDRFVEIIRNNYGEQLC